MFDKKEVRRFRRTCWREFQRMGLKPAEISGPMVLAAVSFFGTDLAVLSEITGLSTEYVQKALRRLRKQRVLSGQTIRVAWNDENSGGMAEMLDAMVAAGIISRRFVNPKRSAAQKARAPETRARGPRKPRTKIAPGATFTPAQVHANPLYGLPEWDREHKAQSA